MKIVMIIAFDVFRDEELFEPKAVFEENGIEVVIASNKIGKAKGKLGAEVDVDINYKDIVVDDYDALVFVGGLGAEVYFDDETAFSIVKKAYEKGKVLGAICIAPSILANAGVLSGKKVTSYASEKDNLESKGAVYTGQDVESDGKIVTANGPDAAKEFGKKIVQLISKEFSSSSSS